MRRYASNALKLTFAGGRSLILSLFMFLASFFHTDFIKLKQFFVFSIFDSNLYLHMLTVFV